MQSLNYSIIRAWLLVVLVLSASLAAPTVEAQSDRSVEVIRRDGTVTIRSDGSVDVVETWQTRFIGGPFRFAFRSIPLNRVESIDAWGVGEQGQDYRRSDSEDPQTFKLEREDNQERVTWYFPATTDATRTFTLRYTLRGALRIYPEGDQFFWKFIEADRGYPIGSSQVTVQLPESFSPQQLMATTYRNTREERDGAQIVSGTTIVFSGEEFPAEQEWEIRVQFPHGTVPDQLPAWQAADDARRAESEAILTRQPFYNRIALITALLTAIGGSLGLYGLWFTRGRDRPVGHIAPYYAAPPADVAPGVVGTLLDESADMQDILATLVDLARRGYLQIVQFRPDSSQGSSDFTFVRGSADPGQLRPFERRLYDKIFGVSIHERQLSSLKNQFYTEVREIERELYAAAVEAGYFDENPDATRGRYTSFGCLGVLVAIAVGFAGMFFERYTPLAPVVIGVVAVLTVAFLILSQFMSRKTEAGATAAAQWQGFKRYLEHPDRYPEGEMTEDQFDRYLPYAIAFGLERQWVRQFEHRPSNSRGWYRPYGYHSASYGSSHGGRIGEQSAAAGAAGLGAGLSEMLTAASSAFTSQPQAASSSSGGASGGSSGGFSGGGVGGGGGGGGSSGFG